MIIIDYFGSFRSLDFGILFSEFLANFLGFSSLFFSNLKIFLDLDY